MIKSILQAVACAAILLFPIAPSVAQSRVKPVKSARRSVRGKTVPADPVDLNGASESELRSVPGIGALTARKIMDGRPYSSVSDLSKAGISAAVIRKIAPNVTAGGKPLVLRRTEATTAAPGGGPGMVWVNRGTKVYHQPGDKWYGRTKNGRYIKERDAIAAGYHASKESESSQ
jgi:hypothetical protein